MKAREAALFRRFFGSSASPKGPFPDPGLEVFVGPDDLPDPDDVSGSETGLASGPHTFHASSQAFLDSLRARA